MGLVIQTWHLCGFVLKELLDSLRLLSIARRGAQWCVLGVGCTREGAPWLLHYLFG